MLYEMLSGKPPLEAEDVFGLVTLLLKKDVEPLTQRFPDIDIPHEVDEIVLRMLQKDPKERPDDAAHLADELERWAIEDPGAAQKAVAVRRGAVAVVAAGVVGAILVFLLAPSVGAPAAAASLGLGAGAAFAAIRFGRPSVLAYVKRVATVLAAVTVLGAISLAIPGAPGVVAALGFALFGLVAYSAFLFVWSHRVKALRVVAAGVAAPLLCAMLFPVRVAPPSKAEYFVDLAGWVRPAVTEDRPQTDAARGDTLIALFAIGGLFGVASILLPRPGAARSH
jgi:hypothetical protein